MRFGIISLAIVLSLTVGTTLLQAQDSNSFPDGPASWINDPPAPKLTLPRYGDVHALPDVLRDERNILTSPFRIKQPDLKWFVPFVAASAALIASDQATFTKAHPSDVTQHVSQDFSDLGSKFPMLGASLLTYTVGRVSSNDRVRETGMLGGQAMFHALVVAEVLKHLTNRRLPVNGGNGHFWNGGHAFPSGHAMTFWAFSTVVAGEASDRPLVKLGIYGLASAVSVSRFTGRVHYPSDVLASTTFGYLIGRYVVRHHSQLHAS